MRVDSYWNTLIRKISWYFKYYFEPKTQELTQEPT